MPLPTIRGSEQLSVCSSPNLRTPEGASSRPNAKRGLLSLTKERALPNKPEPTRTNPNKPERTGMRGNPPRSILRTPEPPTLSQGRWRVALPRHRACILPPCFYPERTFTVRTLSLPEGGSVAVPANPNKPEPLRTNPNEPGCGANPRAPSSELPELPNFQTSGSASSRADAKCGLPNKPEQTRTNPSKPEQTRTNPNVPQPAVAKAAMNHRAPRNYRPMIALSALAVLAQRTSACEG